MVLTNQSTNVEIWTELGLAPYPKFLAPLMTRHAEQINFNATVDSVFQVIYNVLENQNVMMSRTRTNAVSTFHCPFHSIFIPFIAT